MCELCRFNKSEDRRKPYRCPVCNGNGIVDNWFYSRTTIGYTTNSTAFETCRSCHGTGIVWSY